ncbi:hypothetical protein EDB92DRAFT_2103559 [Lactarius akahatsu]|uniref:Uncharacterized protein n=1 Tax=Lactarius akahatsu TaxID=416441 RepID=A0AAD4QDJ8_9AGAM|nr:hypothetical protein EDB92DRAFT_2103559 [Lactarius akahatsu]
MPRQTHGTLKKVEKALIGSQIMGCANILYLGLVIVPVQYRPYRWRGQTMPVVGWLRLEQRRHIGALVRNTPDCRGEGDLRSRLMRTTRGSLSDNKLQYHAVNGNKGWHRQIGGERPAEPSLDTCADTSECGVYQDEYLHMETTMVRRGELKPPSACAFSHVHQRYRAIVQPTTKVTITNRGSQDPLSLPDLSLTHARRGVHRMMFVDGTLIKRSKRQTTTMRRAILAGAVTPFHVAEKPVCVKEGRSENFGSPKARQEGNRLNKLCARKDKGKEGGQRVVMGAHCKGAAKKGHGVGGFSKRDLAMGSGVRCYKQCVTASVHALVISTYWYYGEFFCDMGSHRHDRD